MKADLIAAIGDRGESIFELAMTDYRGLRWRLFKPSVLGDKWAGIDYCVELKGVRLSRPVMFVQVNSTAGERKRLV